MPYHHWTPEEENLLRELLSQKKYSFNQMARFFQNRTGTALRKHALKYMNLSNGDFIFKKHAYNQYFFRTPNPINCYVAGYYAADGHITNNPTTRLLSICAAPIDKHQLELFKRLIEYTGPVTTATYGGHTLCHMRLYGAHQITADLKTNFGLDDDKMYRMPAPNISDERLKLCYLVGLLDGDGCVHVSKQDKLIIKYTSSSQTIVEWVKSFCESLCLRSIARNQTIADVRKLKNANAYEYQIAGSKAVDLVKRVQRLKAEGLPVLDRKWDNPRINQYINDFCTKYGLSL